MFLLYDGRLSHLIKVYVVMLLASYQCKTLLCYMLVHIHDEIKLIFQSAYCAHSRWKMMERTKWTD